MDVTTAQKWMTLFNEKVQANKDYLSELDTPIGDGDHGGNMARGMGKVIEALEAKPANSSSDLFKVVAMQLLSHVGGASGPLYGSAFLGLSKGLASDLPIGEALEAGLDQIMKRGKAQAGEKTMIDVWMPVIADLKKGQLTKEAIQSYVEATKPLKATKGRASYVGERSIGHIDPGSASSGLLFEALLEAEE